MSSPLSFKPDYLRRFVPAFTKEAIDDLIVRSNNNKNVAIYEARCRGCKKAFVIRAYTALNQMAKYAGKFIPPTHCRECFKQARGVSTPTPPTNAIMHPLDESAVESQQNEKTAPHATPSAASVPPQDQLSKPPRVTPWFQLMERRNEFEGSEVVVFFTDKPSFLGDRDTQLEFTTGVCVAMGPLGMSVMEVGAKVYQANTYPSSDVIGINLITEASTEIFEAEIP